MSNEIATAGASQTQPPANEQTAALDVLSTPSDAEIAVLVKEALPPGTEIQPPVVESEKPADAPPTQDAPLDAPPADAPPGDQPEVREPDNRVRIKHMNPQDQANASAIIELTRGGMSLADATRKIIGDELQPAAAPVAEVDPEIAVVDAKRQQLAELQSSRKEKYGVNALPTEELEQMQDRIEDLKLEIHDGQKSIEARAAEQARQSRQQANGAFEQERQAVLADTVKEYPDMANRESAQWKEARRLNDELSNPTHKNNAILQTADAPMFLAELAARNLKKAGVAVASAGKQDEQTAPLISQTIPQGTKPPGPAPGSKQTSPPPPAKTAAEELADVEATRATMFENIQYTPSHAGDLILP